MENKQKILETIDIELEKLEQVIADLEAEMNIIKRRITKKEQILEELKKI